MGLFSRKKDLSAEASILRVTAENGTAEDARKYASFLLDNGKKMGVRPSEYIYWYNVAAVRGDNIARKIIENEDLRSILAKDRPDVIIYAEGMPEGEPVTLQTEKTTDPEDADDAAEETPTATSSGDDPSCEKLNAVSVTKGKVDWNYNKKTCEITFTGSGIMPDSRKWLKKQEDIMSVRIEGDISICEGAFENCTALENVTVNGDVAEIRDGAFRNCKALRQFVAVSGKPDPQIATIIGSGAFALCDELTTFRIGTGLSTIGENAFSGCSSMTLFEYRDDVSEPGRSVSIGDRSFHHCSHLTRIKLPSGLESIGVSAFEMCEELPNIEIPDTVTSIGEGAFRSCIHINHIRLPPMIREIPAYAFSGCKAARDIVLPDGIEAIGDRAFLNCISVTELHLPGSVRTIGYGAFCLCESVKIIQLNEGLERVDKHAFNGCGHDCKPTLPASIRYIGDSAFAGCFPYGAPEIPDTVEFVGSEAFSRHGISNTSSVQDVDRVIYGK